MLSDDEIDSKFKANKNKKLVFLTKNPFLYKGHLFLGCNGWWDFNETTETWTQNEFFGKKHPWDMLHDGEVIPGLKLV